MNGFRLNPFDELSFIELVCAWALRRLCKRTDPDAGKVVLTAAVVQAMDDRDRLILQNLDTNTSWLTRLLSERFGNRTRAYQRLLDAGITGWLIVPKGDDKEVSQD